MFHDVWNMESMKRIVKKLCDSILFNLISSVGAEICLVSGPLRALYERTQNNPNLHTPIQPPTPQRQRNNNTSNNNWEVEAASNSGNVSRPQYHISIGKGCFRFDAWTCTSRFCETTVCLHSRDKYLECTSLE